MDPLGVGRERAGGDGVDGDALGPDLAREGAGEADDGTLRGDVVEEARPADKEGYGGYVDDAPVPALPHMREGGPGAQEVAFKVYGHHPVPLVFLDLGPRAQRVDGCVVHEDVYAAELGRDVLRHRLDGGPVGDVCLERDAAGAARRCQLCDPLGLIERLVYGGHGGAGRGERRADALGEAATAAGHYRYPDRKSVV